MTRTGHCLCGAVHFTITAEPVACRACWCRDCQHLAANGTVNILVPTEALEVSGALSGFTKIADSGNEVVRQFCPGCGSQLFVRNAGRPHLTVVRVGNLDDPSSVRPSGNIWTTSAPAWGC